MIALVLGKPSSGKSAFAEELALNCSFSNRYYIATMKVMDDEGRKRIERHRIMRKGKGFVTLEIPIDIMNALDHMPDPKESVVLLECVANLTGNMLYDTGYTHALAKSIADCVSGLSSSVGQLIAVSSEYEPDRFDDEETAVYKKVLNEVNIILKDRADEVYDMSDLQEGKG